jgi:hypothetical protein
MFNTGDIVVYINSDGDEINLFELIIGHNYVVMECFYVKIDYMYYVRVKPINANNDDGWYMAARFIKLTDYRKQKIKKLKDV